MAETKGQSSSGSGAPGAAGGAAGDGARAGGSGVQMKNLWPIPALGVATAMLVGGLALVVMNRPQPPASLPLELALEAVKEEKYEDALDRFKAQDVQRYLVSAEATEKQRAEFYLGRARSLYGAQEHKGIAVAANYRNVVGDYEHATELMHGTGTELEAGDVSRLAESYLAIGDVEKTLATVRMLPAGEQARKTRLNKKIVEKNLEDNAREEMSIDLLAQLSADPDLSSVDKAWVLARQAELLIAGGHVEDALNRLVRRIGLLRDVPAEQQGELYLILARAYVHMQQPASAQKQFDAADQLIDKMSPMRTLMYVLQGQIAQADGDLGIAKEKYLAVVQEFGASPYVPQAMLGLAEVEAAQGATDHDRGDQPAIERYSAVVEIVGRAKSAAAAPVGGGHGHDEHGGGHGDGHEHSSATASAGTKGANALPPVDVPTVLESLMQRSGERFDSGNIDSSLRYAMLAESMFDDKSVPSDVLLAIARSHRSLGDEVMNQARSMRKGANAAGEFRVSDLDAATQAEVRRHYTIAGDYFRRHASSVSGNDQGTARTGAKPGSYAESLWLASDSFDLAGELDEARKAFQQYADGASDNDPKRPEARYRLAQIFQAQGDFASAAGVYRQLVQGRGRAGTPGTTGRWADLSMVPLARCLIADNDPANDTEAERLLLGVMDGTTVTPEAPSYREALLELGTLCYSSGRYADAIGWLDQAVKRSKNERRVEAARYRLADSHRLEAGRIAKTLEQKLPQTQADELTMQREEHLKDARRQYAQVRQNLETRGIAGLDDLERVYLRNAYFYAGDCAFDQGDYDGAIAAYDTARLKYAEDPASLAAMAQIVSAYIAQKQWAQARTANERARQQMARFPESVWSRGDLPMEKQHWEKWLEAQTVLQQSAGADGDTGSGAGR